MRYLALMRWREFDSAHRNDPVCGHPISIMPQVIELWRSGNSPRLTLFTTISYGCLRCGFGQLESGRLYAEICWPRSHSKEQERSIRNISTRLQAGDLAPLGRQKVRLCDRWHSHTDLNASRRIASEGSTTPIGIARSCKLFHCSPVFGVYLSQRSKSLRRITLL
jgi:hypothetical protein